MSTGCGEDYFFSYRCKEFNIERYMDTSVKTDHLVYEPRWANEGAYWDSREKEKESYIATFGDCIKDVVDGKVVITDAVGAVV